MDTLQYQVQTLRGQVEQLTRQPAASANQQKTMYTDLDRRYQATFSRLQRQEDSTIVAATLSSSRC